MPSTHAPQRGRHLVSTSTHFESRAEDILEFFDMLSTISAENNVTACSDYKLLWNLVAFVSRVGGLVKEWRDADETSSEEQMENIKDTILGFFEACDAPLSRVERYIEDFHEDEDAAGNIMQASVLSRVINIRRVTNRLQAPSGEIESFLVELEGCE